MITRVVSATILTCFLMLGQGSNVKVGPGGKGEQLPDSPDTGLIKQGTKPKAFCPKCGQVDTLSITGTYGLHLNDNPPIHTGDLQPSKTSLIRPCSSSQGDFIRPSAQSSGLSLDESSALKTANERVLEMLTRITKKDPTYLPKYEAAEENQAHTDLERLKMKIDYLQGTVDKIFPN